MGDSYLQLQLHGLHHLLQSPSSSSLLLFTFKPLCVTATAFGLPKVPKPITVQSFVAPLPPTSPPRHRFFCSSPSSTSLTYLGVEIEIETPSPNFLSEKESSSLCSSEEEEEVQLVDDPEESVELEALANASRTEPIEVSANAGKPLNLSVKEKKELASYAHSLGKKLKSQQVGKSGVTPSVAASFIENLESNELLKLKVHNNCPGELADVVKQLEEATGSVTVGQIGRTVILYRPSLSKLKAEEKKKQAQRVFMRKRSILKPPDPKGQFAKPSNRGHRGSSRI